MHVGGGVEVCVENKKKSVRFANTITDRQTSEKKEEEIDRMPTLFERDAPGD